LVSYSRILEILGKRHKLDYAKTLIDSIGGGWDSTAEQTERQRSASKEPVVRVRDVYTRKEGRVVGRSRELRRRGRGGYQRMCQEEAQQTAPQGANQHRRLKDGRRHIGYLRATKDETAERKRITSKSPEKQ
jgi:hypothetical protein